MLLRVLVVLVLVGCATGYGKQGLTGGYTETQLGANIFQVRFRGNGFTSSEKTQDFTLLRCAELAKLNGFTHFVIVEGQSQTSQSTYKSPTHTKVDATVVGNSVYGKATTTGGQTYTISKPTRSNTILCFRGQPKQYAMSYESSYIINAIKQKWGIKGASSATRPSVFSSGVRKMDTTQRRKPMISAEQVVEKETRNTDTSGHSLSKASSTGSFSGIREHLSVSSFRSFGLVSLTDEEIRNFDRWIGTVWRTNRPIDLLESMNVSTYESAGLGKLAQLQLEQLENWLNSNNSQAMGGGSESPNRIEGESQPEREMSVANRRKWLDDQMAAGRNAHLQNGDGISPETIRELARSEEWIVLRPKGRNPLKCKITELKDSQDPVIKLKVQVKHGVYSEE